MANPLKDYEFEALFTADEQPGSQAAYRVEREVQRRRELAQQVVDAKLIEAADAQIAAAAATVESAESARVTAKWTRISSIAVAITVVLMAIGTWIDATRPPM